MHSGHHQRSVRTAAAALLIVTVAAWGADQSGHLTAVRMMLHNAVNPGRLALLSLSSAAARPAGVSQTPPGELQQLQDALLMNELQRRQLLLENARLQRQLHDHQQTARIQTVTSPDLVNFVALEARVLSHAGLSGPLRNAIIDVGSAHGVRESELIVSGDGLVVDKGSDHRLAAGDKVAHGAAIIGRIAQLSRWVSLVQPVTDSEYSGAVQLVSISDQGAGFGARGLLQGTGDGLCRVTGIPYTESVSVGDEVFAASVQGVNGPRLYYGPVIHAAFSEGGQWDIVVRPAFDAHQLNEVAIVKPRLNPQRTERTGGAAERTPR